MKRCLLLTTEKTNPWNNLAREEYLMGLCRREEGVDDEKRPFDAILFLWQNEHTVVVGRNQNVWAEAKTALLEEEGGFLARRSTGGGAVYHDLGNLNFSIILPTPDFQLDRTFGFILDLVRSLGIEAVRSGRNDVLVDGRKFSGSAFRQLAGVGLHHGTLLIRSDYARVGRYLTVSSEKLKSKAVTSVRSRVTNLCDVKPDITVAEVLNRALSLFPSHFAPGLNADRADDTSFPQDQRLKELEDHYASWAWRYGRTFQFTTRLEHRFDWGQVDLQFSVAKGLVQDLAFYSDALDSDAILEQGAALVGLPFHSRALADQLLSDADQNTVYDVSRQKMAEDLAWLLLEQGW